MNEPEDSTGQSYWAIVRRQFMRRKLAVFGLCFVAVFVLIALLAPLIANDQPIVVSWRGEMHFPAFTTYIEAFPVPSGIVKWLRRIPFFSDHYPELAELEIFETDPKTGHDKKVYPTWKALIRNEHFKKERGNWAWMPPIPYGFKEQNLLLRKKKPGDPVLAGTKHYLGTDDLGRDVLARMIHGTIVAMTVGLLSVSIYITIGIIIGSLAGYFGGWVDMAISRVIEVVICFPTLFLILTVVAFFGNSIYWIIILLGLIRWTGPARLIRGEFLKNKTEDYVTAGRALGLSNSRLIFRHLVPNCIAPVLVSATFGISYAILIESSLSFLGFGVAPPMASWGDIGSQGRQYLPEGLYHLVLYPGLATFVTITAFNIVGESLRDAMDPRLKA